MFGCNTNAHRASISQIWSGCAKELIPEYFHNFCQRARASLDKISGFVFWGQWYCCLLLNNMFNCLNHNHLGPLTIFELLLVTPYLRGPLPCTSSLLPATRKGSNSKDRTFFVVFPLLPKSVPWHDQISKPTYHLPSWHTGFSWCVGCNGSCVAISATTSLTWQGCSEVTHTSLARGTRWLDAFTHYLSRGASLFSNLELQGSWNWHEVIRGLINDAHSHYWWSTDIYSMTRINTIIW